MTINQLITASGGQLTTSNVMTQPLSASVWQSIWNDAVANQVSLLNCSSTPTPAPCSAASALSGTNALDFGSGSSTDVKLCQLVSINVSTNGSTCTSGNLPNAALSANLDALQTLTTEAELANGTNALDLGTALGITGVSDATLTLDLGTQVPQVAYGPVGTTASTEQVSATLALNFLGSGWVDIPLSAAQGTATLTTLTCAYNSMTATDIQPITNAVTGTVSVAGTNVGTLTVSGLTTVNASPVPFAAGVVPPTATTEFPTPPHPPTNPHNAVAAPLTTLSYSGLTVTNPSNLYTLLTSTLPSVVPPILQVAGAPVGSAVVGGTRWGAPRWQT